VYALVENARRAARHETLPGAQSRSAEIWSAFSRVAETTPGAWLPKAMTPDEVATPAPANRIIAFPYTKLMCANPGVDQAAAVIVTSAAAADRLGVPRERRVYLHAEAGASDTVDILERPTYERSEAIELTLTAVLSQAGVEADELDLIDLYSCFPIVPKLAADALGIGGDRALSVTGGLTFFGGPGCAYPVCSSAAMVRRLRDGEGRIGLVHANGEYVTKQHALVLGTEPPRTGAFATDSQRTSRQAQLDGRQRPTFDSAPEGTGVVEAFTVVHDREGEAETGVIIGRLPNGSRFIANTARDHGTLDELESPTAETIGRSGRVDSHGTTNEFRFVD
jgi:acetyl-CoA C-acetyltransferase